MREVNRREFIAGAAAFGGALALTGCTRQEQELTTEDNEDNANGESGGFQADIEADAIILGGGLAGVGAAGALVLGGASVALVEKGTMLLAASWPSPIGMAMAQFNINRPYWQFEPEKTEDTEEAFIARWRKVTEVGKRDVPYPDYARVLRLGVEVCNTAYILGTIGMPFRYNRSKDVAFPSAATDSVIVDRPEEEKRTGGQMLGDFYQGLLEENNATLLFETAGTELIVEGDRVVGVKVEGKEGTKTIKAKAVILASGGYAGSDEYRQRWIPEVDATECVFVGLPINTGDAITMGSACGAALYEDGWVVCNGLTYSKGLRSLNPDFVSLPVSKKGIYVNAKGERFLNEAADNSTYITTLVDSKAGPYYVLYDGSDSEVTGVLETGVGSGEAFKADTIEQLAQDSGLSGLAGAFSQYQTIAVSGTDTAFSKPVEQIEGYAGSGPYYLARIVPSYVATLGGLKTNDDCQVLREDGSVIDGLFAAGETTHRFMYNRSFIMGASNGYGLTMGRLTGEYIVQNVL